MFGISRDYIFANGQISSLITDGKAPESMHLKSTYCVCTLVLDYTGTGVSQVVCSADYTRHKQGVEADMTADLVTVWK